MTGDDMPLCEKIERAVEDALISMGGEPLPGSRREREEQEAARQKRLGYLGLAIRWADQREYVGPGEVILAAIEFEKWAEGDQ